MQYLRLLVVLIAVLLGSTPPLFGQTVRLVWNTLFVQAGDSMLPVISFANCSELRGYSIVDRSHLFIARENRNSTEASTVIEVYDMDERTFRLIGEIGGTGESVFEYNVDNDMVVYSIDGEVYLFKIHDENKKVVSRVAPQLLHDIRTRASTFPFWIDNATVGIVEAVKEKLVVHKISIK